MRNKWLFIALIASLCLTGCETEFSPNADWKNIPSIFCVLDQDDDTTFVRLQKCYLGNGNLYSYSGIRDSIFYPEDAVSVAINVWNSMDDMNRGDARPVKILDFAYSEIDGKEAGDFASERQPIYYHVNQAGELSPDYVYQLVVTDRRTNKQLASASTILVGNEDPNKGWLVNPFPADGPNPNSKTFNMLTGRCEIKWRQLANGRRYQPSIRFFYRYRYAPDSLRFCDINCNQITTNGISNELSTYVEKWHYLEEIKKQLVDDTCHKLFVDTVMIRMYACNEDFNAYIATTTDNNSTTQDRLIYSNIEGGVGVFGSRRTHLQRKVLADNGDNPNGMHHLLEDLHVGFEQSPR